MKMGFIWLLFCLDFHVGFIFTMTVRRMYFTLVRWRHPAGLDTLTGRQAAHGPEDAVSVIQE